MRRDVPSAVRPVRVQPSALERAGEWSLHLPFQTVDQIPSLNDREHWRVTADKVALWRQAAHALAMQAKIPRCKRVLVELHYVPATNRRRDPDNLVKALKPLIDGLVDAKVVPDDTLEYVERTFPIIHPWRATLATRGDSRFILRVVAL